MWVGTPSVFVRVSGCNLRCSWCDTPYASWTPEGPVTDVSEVLEKVLSFGIEHVVLTGGEPMMFDPVEELASGLKKNMKAITIETAGTVYRNLDCDLMSISPKLSNSTPSALAGEKWAERHEQTRSDRTPLRRLIQSYPYQLKFVVNPESNMKAQLEEIDDVLSEINASARNVLLMAEGTDATVLHARERLLVPVCMAKGFRLTPRLHIDLFGNTRGT
jgi:7-carboxy-7-deazaguanine synthase